ncbi:MAG: hypothetical protein HeimC2_23990 [Candidatus Heimdallarchaeota archaeon LC_2]|nr:MAG: hypothetical protein HeimC2_23990 [Candidatus Heimdallarchaeota archaeon LC_2]
MEINRNIDRSLNKIGRFFHFFRILFAVAKRSLIVDFRYKFQLVVEATWTALNVAVFVLLGVAWQETATTDGVPYSMVTFFIVATGFFTVFAGVMETTVTAITEENQLGTMGFLVTNSVSPVAIIMGRYLAATVRWFIILITIVFPPLLITGVVPSSLPLLWSSIIVFFIAWIFFMGFGLILTSIALIIKKTTTFNRVAIYIARFASGAFVPLISFDNSLTIFNKPLSNYMIWFPPAFCLEVLRWVFTVKNENLLNPETPSTSKDGLVYSGFNDVFGTNITDLSLSDPMVKQMLIVVFGFLFFAIFIVTRLTTLSRKWGTIEFY